jgi:hypothetical protein
LCFLCYFFSFFSHSCFIFPDIPMHLLFFKALIFILRNPSCWQKFEIKSYKHFLIFLNNWDLR